MSEDEISGPKFTPVDDLILDPADFPVKTVYSWERHGEFFSLFPGDEGEPPYDAPEIHVRLYPFPDGQVREIHLDARMRTHHHISHEDILFYQVSGRRVQIVNERSREVNVGDASIQIAGVWKRVDQIIPGLFIEFSMLRPKKEGAEATWVKNEDGVVVEVAEWTENGRQVYAEGASAAYAPADAHRYVRRTFDLQGYKLHELTLPKGAVASPPAIDVDTNFYICSGAMKARVGEVEGKAVARGAMRAPAGVSWSVEALEDSLFIYAPIPPTRPPV